MTSQLQSLHVVESFPKQLPSNNSRTSHSCATVQTTSSVFGRPSYLDFSRDGCSKMWAVESWASRLPRKNSIYSRRIRGLRVIVNTRGNPVISSTLNVGFTEVCLWGNCVFHYLQPVGASWSLPSLVNILLLINLSRLESCIHMKIKRVYLFSW